MGEYGIGSRKTETRYLRSNFFLGITYFFLFATPYSLLSFVQHPAKDQRFHMLDVIPADLVGDGANSDRTRHRVAAEKQMIAGADQAGVEQERIGDAGLERTN